MNPSIPATPPNLPGLTWRPIDRQDLEALVELSGACHRADGGLSFMFEPEEVESRYLAEATGAATGVFTVDGRLAASAAVRLDGEADPPRAPERRAIIVGQVRPELRGRGIGESLMRWSLAQARASLAQARASLAQARAVLPEAAPGKGVLQVATETLTGPAHRLYRSHGFEQVFESLVMRREFDGPLPASVLPPGVSLTTWQPEVAEQFYQAYHPAFKERPGFPGWSSAEWIGRVTADDLVPEWSLLAQSGGEPAGFVIGCADLTTRPPGGFIWQVGVIPAWRRRGLASALMVESMRRMQAAGSEWALLTVHTDNPGAIEAYRRLGFTTIGSRARYERKADFS